MRHETRKETRVNTVHTQEIPLSRYLHFSREAWAERCTHTPLTLSEERLVGLRSLNDRLSLKEVEQIYLPLSYVLNLHVTASQALHAMTSTFLGHARARVPYLIGLAGSVAVGKSTVARLLQALITDWPECPRVDLVTTDGFLYPNHTLHARGLMKRKGFPESYDVPRLVRFLAEVKAGKAPVRIPVYSHLLYDIVPGQQQQIYQPDILIVEGLNILQGAEQVDRGQRLSVSDFFDLTIYLDAEERAVEQWYIERFLLLCQTAFQDPSSYFTHFAHLNGEEAIQTAREIWREINGPNLRENIAPTRERAHVIIKKGGDHRVEEIRLRKL